MNPIETHNRHACAVRAAATGASGQTDASLRAAVLARAAGGPAIPEPYDTLSLQIGEGAGGVSDAQVAAVRDHVGSNKAAFEIIMTASIGARLARWDAAIRAIEGAGDAAD